jgi:hypothetical protein
MASSGSRSGSSASNAAPRRVIADATGLPALDSTARASQPEAPGEHGEHGCLGGEGRGPLGEDEPVQPAIARRGEHRERIARRVVVQMNHRLEHFSIAGPPPGVVCRDAAAFGEDLQPRPTRLVVTLQPAGERDSGWRHPSTRRGQPARFGPVLQEPLTGHQNGGPVAAEGGYAQ